MPEEPRWDGSERYELTDLFSDISPESAAVYTAIGIVIALLVLGLAFAYPWAVS